MGRQLSLIAVSALVASAVTHWVLWRQQAKSTAVLTRLAESLNEPTPESDRGGVSYQIKMNGGLTKDELRAVIREELAATRTTSPGTAEREIAAEQTKSVRSPENQQAFQSAQRLVEQALSGGVWADQQAQELTVLRRELTAEQYRQLMGALIPAINDQKVRITTAGPPF